jgi:hypothetical protein
MGEWCIASRAEVHTFHDVPSLQHAAEFQHELSRIGGRFSQDHQSFDDDDNGEKGTKKDGKHEYPTL